MSNETDITSAAGEPLKVALMSFAHVHAESYAKLLSGRSDVVLRASDPDAATAPAGELRGRAFAEAIGIDYVESYDELLAWGPDAVIVASENAKHRPLVEAAAAAGAHVLCEKPLATTLDDALAMQAACNDAGVTLMTAYPVRFAPSFTKLKSLVDAGGLGALLSATGTNNGQLPGGRAWFTDPELSGGGAMVDHIVHIADLLDLLTGLEARSVRAVSNRILHADKPHVKAETGGLVTVRYDGGFVATIDCSWSQPDSAPTWGGLTLQIIGSDGIAGIDPFAQHVGGFSENDRNGLFLGYGTDTDELMLAEFLSCVRTGSQPQPDGASGIRSLRIVLAAQESARTGEVVSIG